MLGPTRGGRPVPVGLPGPGEGAAPFGLRLGRRRKERRLLEFWALATPPASMSKKTIARIRKRQDDRLTLFMEDPSCLVCDTVIGKGPVILCFMTSSVPF